MRTLIIRGHNNQIHHYKKQWGKSSHFGSHLAEEGEGAPDGVVVVGEGDGAEAALVVAMHLVLCRPPEGAEGVRLDQIRPEQIARPEDGGSGG